MTNLVRQNYKKKTIVYIPCGISGAGIGVASTPFLDFFLISECLITVYQER
jgi:D-serine dehydratase